MSSVLCLGQATQDFIFAVDAIPQQAEKFRASGFHNVGGGPAANAAVTINKLGGRAALAARLGKDNIAEFVLAELQSYGVDCSLMQQFPGCRSSLSSVLVDKNGERMIVNYLDPNLPTDTAHLPTSLPGNIKVVLADTRWPEGAEYILALAKNAGRPAILDADRPLPSDGALLKVATHITFSTAGLQDFSGHKNYEQALLKINADTDTWCCVTLGASGVLCVEQQNIKRFPAFQVPPVDTLGAGDVWHGAFALAIAEGKKEIQAIRFANAAAALKAQRFGGRSGIPEREQVDLFMSENTIY